MWGREVIQLEQYMEPKSSRTGVFPANWAREIS